MSEEENTGCSDAFAGCIALILTVGLFGGIIYGVYKWWFVGWYSDFQENLAKEKVVKERNIASNKERERINKINRLYESYRNPATHFSGPLELMVEVEENILRFNTQYEGRAVNVNGVVRDLGTSSFDLADSTAYGVSRALTGALGIGAGFGSIACVPPEFFKHRIVDLDEGDLIFATGFPDASKGELFGTLSAKLTNCVWIHGTDDQGRKLNNQLFENADMSTLEWLQGWRGTITPKTN